MNWISVDGIRKIETAAFTRRRVSSYMAMCRAGASVAELALRIATRRHYKKIVVVIGTGNNGGDGCVVAKCLKEDGFDVMALMICVPAQLSGDARRAWEDMHNAGVPYRVCVTHDTWEEDAWLDSAVFPRQALIIDALLGIGAKGELRQITADAVQWMNRVGKRNIVISIDSPSGLDCDRGEALGGAVEADFTVTFTRPKIGFCKDSAQKYLGHVHVVDIGIPNDLLDEYDDEQRTKQLDTSDETATSIDLPPFELLAYPEMRPSFFIDRELDSCKNTFGHTLIFGGSECYPHAPVLSGLGVLRSGAGLVTLSVPESSCIAAAVHLPEAILKVRHAGDTIIAGSFLDDLYSGKYTSAAIGPGLGRSDHVRHIVHQFIQKTQKMRIVVDADALYYLADMYEHGWRPDPAQSMVITPHPGEAATLLGITSKEVQENRVAAAKELARRYHAIVVLKGMRSLIANPDGGVWICMAGNPGMATAGMGDILTGMIAGLIARGMGIEAAARVGCYRHAVAGDFAAITHGQESMVATDIFDELAE